MCGSLEDTVGGQLQLYLSKKLMVM